MGRLLRNRGKPNGRAYVWLALTGALMILPVGLAGIGVAGLVADAGSALARNFALAVLGSSLPEEIARFAVLGIIGMRWIGFARPLDGPVFGAAVALGFSVAENLLYGVSFGWHMALFKLAIATPIHLALGVTMGGLLVIATGVAPARRRVMLALALALPVLLHGIYDLAVLTAIGTTASDGPDATRLIVPAMCYSMVLGFALYTGRRAGKVS